MTENLFKDMDFIVEIDKMKSTLRKTKLIGKDEFEDDAQHSWHIATMALILKDYADEDVDIDKVIRMLLVHDLVEIYAGDTFGYDKEGYKDKLERETKAAEKLFSMLDEEKGAYLRGLWDEFEEEKTDDALLALSMDRIQPILTNFHNNGGTWVEYGVKASDIRKRVAPIKESSKSLWDYVNKIIDESIKRGYIEE